MVFLYQAASGRGIICRLFEGKTKKPADGGFRLQVTAIMKIYSGLSFWPCLRSMGICATLP